MPDIRMPDGKVVRFPDDMPKDQIKSIIQSKLGAAPPQEQQLPAEGAAREFADFASGATQNPARAQYDEVPAWQKPLVAGSDILQTFANGATMGFGDKAVAGARSMFTDKPYEEELAEQRRLTQGARNRAGGAGTAAEITGAIATPVKLAGKGATMTGRLGTAGMTGKTGLAARTGLMGAESAGYGALTAAGNDQDIATGAVIGLGGGLGGNLLGEGISALTGKVAGAFNKAPPKVTVDELKEAGRASLKRAESAGVIFNKQGVDDLTRKVIDDATEHGFDPANEPGVRAVLTRLNSMRGGNVTLKGLETLRKVASNGYDPLKKSNNELLRKVIGRIDELVENSDPSTVLVATKNPKAAAEAMKDYRAHWSRAKKLETVEKYAGRGEHIANSQISGDVGNATRKQMRSLLDNDAKTRGFTAAEKAQLEKAAGMSGGRRALHAVGGLMPRDRLSTAVHAAAGLSGGLATGGATVVPQIAAMITGYGAQKTAEHLARKSVAELTDLIGRGGVPAPLVKNVIQRLTAAKRDSLSRALMAISVNRGSANEAPAQQQ